MAACVPVRMQFLMIIGFPTLDQRPTENQRGKLAADSESSAIARHVDELSKRSPDERPQGRDIREQSSRISLRSSGLRLAQFGDANLATRICNAGCVH